ncbi:B3 domain-containing protein Os03g0212300-like [Apium graveolens]|uniref:B3 domain-containing protein Os03g0212300-like n=1 Tax=Apium graveolens TaxID=4045 RepID=UPI003D79B079
MGRRPPARKPSFMKILVKDFSTKLMIPPQFVKLHRGTLARRCTLRPSGTADSWRVRTKLMNNLLYFKKGWKKFAQHHSLGFGDLLVFRHAQDCEFHVDIFDKSCCCKDPVTSQNVESQKDNDSILTSTGLEKNLDPKTPALEAAEDFMASSEFPTFNRIMQPSYVGLHHGYMLIKPDFAKLHIKDRTREVKIEISGKTWTVRLRKHGSSHNLSACWTQLARENALKVGDVCVFELINAKDHTLKLSIFRSTMKIKTGRSKARSGKGLKAQSSKALTSANEFSSLSKYPSCPCLVHFTYLRGGYLQVPSAFVKQMKVTAGAKKVKLECGGKEWNALLSSHGSHRRLSHGWSALAKHNSLQIGDACVLELIHTNDAVIKITVFKSHVQHR